jgi:RimJ/RimL family protein N-acetyltransferase
MEHFPATLSAPESERMLRRLQGDIATRGYGLWAAELRNSASPPVLIGLIGIQPVPAELPFAPAVEVGWRLARAYWRQGLAAEGARAAIDFGFRQVGLEEIVAQTAAVNVRSRRLMERLGMSRDPAQDFRHPAVPAGHPTAPHVLYRLSAVRAG